MKQNNHKKLAREWFDIGDNEFGFAKAGFKDLDSFYPQICFECQQAIEKYLKGFLVFSGQYFPKTHDLVELLKLCAKIDKEFLKLRKEASVVDQY